MTTFESTVVSVAPEVSSPSLGNLPLLQEVPKLLEYRTQAADPDIEFIPKTIIGFAFGALTTFVCLDLAEALVFHRSIPLAQQAWDLGVRFAFMVGITFVAISLLLVGLKVRAEHHKVPLFARHWMNSITTGALYAIMIWAPWLLWSQGFHVNRFVCAATFMLLMAFPAVAARWTIAPHRECTAEL
jgi:hypothetical protein